MKKSLVVALAVVALASAVVMAGHFTETLPPQAANGAVPVSNGYDWSLSTDTGAPSITAASPIQLWSRTLAQMNALAPTAAGQAIYVSDATTSRVCVSSGTGAGAWVVASASSTFAGGSYPHCS
jgi:hypothetical protein